MYANQAEELLIYQISKKLTKEVHTILDNTQKEWKFSSIKQIKRSSLPVSANIAEGFFHRFYPKKFILYLNNALGSSDETKDHLNGLLMNDLISNSQRDYYFQEYKFLSIKILNFINYLKKKHKILL